MIVSIVLEFLDKMVVMALMEWKVKWVIKGHREEK